MTTPESKVKQKVRKILNDFSAYYVMPVTGGYGNSGAPDFIACYNGRFYGIECKANGGRATALQHMNLRRIVECGGIAMIIDENNIDEVKRHLEKP